jgi:aminoglycoside 2'-N-acetyltransferase I
MPQVRVVTDAEARTHVLLAIHELVVAAFDGEFSDKDWQHSQGGWRVLAYRGDELVAHAAVVPRVLRVGERELHTGYVEAVATEPERQRQGLGSLVMTAANDVVRDNFEMGALSTGLTGFFARHGWESWHGPTYVRDGDAIVRTPEEDDGVMVLRFGPSESIDLEAPITCDARPGDAW